jgi:hypothetical protein
MESTVVSVRIDKRVKEKLEKEGIDLSYEFKAYIQRRTALLNLKETVDELAVIIDKKVKPSRKGFAESFVRHDRDAAH